MSDPPTWDELRESGVEIGILGDSGINDFALFREQFKERIYTVLDLTAEERELADAVGAVWETENEIFRLRREAFIEHAHAVAEQISAELAEKLQLPDGYTVVFDETPL